MTVASSNEPLDDRYYEAVVEFVRICRADDRASDDTRPSMRRRVVEAHLIDVSTRHGLDKGLLGRLVTDMLEGTKRERTPAMVYEKPEDPDFDATSARMGYDGMVRATTRMIDGLRYEFGIVDMSESTIGTEAAPWAVVVHQDCDPDEPNQGASSRNDHATFALALADFEEEIRNAEARRPFGL